MHFAVIDDDPHILNILPKLIKANIDSLNVEISCFDSGIEYLDKHLSMHCDALFLDIDMPELNGFDLAVALQKRNDSIPIVYVTGRDDLIINAFRYRPIGFVRKHRIEAELPFAIKTVLDVLKVDNLRISITEPKSLGGKTYSVLIYDITYLKNVKHYVEFHLLDGTHHTVRENISAYITKSEFSNFILIDAGTFVNLAHMTIIKDTVRLPSNQILYISRRKVQSVLKAYLGYNKKELI